MILLDQDVFPSRLYFLPPQNMPVSELCVITNGHFHATMYAGVWHTMPLAFYAQTSNSLCGKCDLAGGSNYGVCACVCVCDNAWPMLHYLRHSHTRWAAS